jgi:deoxyribodipyrimidine photo-lyase
VEQHRRAIVWLRRDLRLRDYVALFEAAGSSHAICVAFVVDPALLASERMGGPLVAVFFRALQALRDDLRTRGSELALLCGDPATELRGFARRIEADALFFNDDYEPDAIARDDAVARTFERDGIPVRRYLDHVYFGADDVSSAAGAPYKVFTPYRRAWLERRAADPRPPVPSERALRKKLLPHAQIGETAAVPMPEAFGFVASAAYPLVSEQTAAERLRDFLAPGGPVERYKEQRDLPAIDGTSRLSPHLRAGTIGIRTCVEAAFERRAAVDSPESASVDAWIGELIWRDFYQTILKRFPAVANGPFLASGATIRWRDDPQGFADWARGATGYPIVDAAMRQLNETGWMHNRLRMIVASFLTKHLLIDWRRGERYFERQLIDADLAQNNGGWQWAASTGTDAVPYFRIFNPTLQGRRFDPHGAFIRRMIPELAAVPDAFIHEPSTMPPLVQREAGVTIGETYPAPIVDHRSARLRALEAYAPRR